jgi:hypothetical protein
MLSLVNLGVGFRNGALMLVLGLGASAILHAGSIAPTAPAVTNYACEEAREDTFGSFSCEGFGVTANDAGPVRTTEEVPGLKFWSPDDPVDTESEGDLMAGVAAFMANFPAISRSDPTDFLVPFTYDFLSTVFADHVVTTKQSGRKQGSR